MLGFRLQTVSFKFTSNCANILLVWLTNSFLTLLEIAFLQKGTITYDLLTLLIVSLVLFCFHFGKHMFKVCSLLMGAVEVVEYFVL